MRDGRNHRQTGIPSHAIRQLTMSMQGAADPKQPYTYADFDYNGIYHVPVKADGSVYLAPIRLSDIFEVIGRGTDDEGTHYHIIRYGDNEHCIIPRGDVGTSEGWRYLRNVINVPSARRKLDLLTEYIQTEAMKPEVMAAEWRITDVAGWHDDAYILPNGDIIGDNERLYFSGKIGYNKRIGYKSGGSLEEWQEQIGRYAVGNSRICLMLGAAFAAPLLGLLNLDGGILHIFGQSSSGKTTIQRIAQSVWGHGRDTGENWNTTPYALLNNAAARNDGLLALDEMGEDATGKAVDQSIYTLANGKGRALGAKDGGNRAEIRFRTLTVSTGETTLESHLSKHGKITMAGHMVRCLSIPHSLDNHHQFPDFRAFTQHMNGAVCHYYGSPGRAFIRHLLADKNVRDTLAKRFAGRLEALQRDYVVNDQMARAARMFAVAMVALELACEWNLTGFVAADAMDGINRCFADWLGMQPRSESYESMQILRAAGDFMQTQDPYFLNPENPPLYPFSKPFPGYVRRGTYDTDEDLYYVLPQEFREKIVQGFEEKKVKEELYKAGWLLRDETNDRWTTQLYGKDPATGRRKRLGYFLVFRGISPPTDTET